MILRNDSKIPRPAMRRLPCNIFSPKRDQSDIRLPQACNAAEKGCLARSVRPKNCGHLSRSSIKGNAADDVIRSTVMSERYAFEMKHYLPQLSLPPRFMR